MIFVTVGTHEQQFNRLVEYMDKWSMEHDEEVVIQIGFSTYVPRNAKWQKIYTYSEMIDNVNKARIVITHGGPSSFIMPLQIGKIPIVMPRKHDFSEHVNNHQVDFCEKVAKQYGSIIVVKDVDELGYILDRYDEVVGSMRNDIRSNNKHFCEEFEKIVDNLMKPYVSKSDSGKIIVVNAVLAFEQPRGVGRYINNLLPALAQIDKINQYYIYYGEWMRKYEFLQIQQSNFHFIELDIKNTMFSRNMYLALKLPLECRKYKPDIFFLVDTQAIIIKPCKVVSTIHDLAEFEVPEKYSSKRAFIRRQIVKHQAKISDHIMTVSQYSKNDICSRFNIKPKRVSVIYNSVKTPNIQKFENPEKYFLFVSEIEYAKNLATLIKAYALLPDEIKAEYKIYVVGKKGNDYDNVLKLIESEKLNNRVVFWGFVSDEKLEELYSKAFCFIFPSIFEGFGLPVLEAMSKGTPVICSNSSSIPEVGGEAVLTFDPFDDRMLSAQICKLITDNELRDKMIIKGIERSKMFNKASVAQETLNVLMNV